MIWQLRRLEQTLRSLLADASYSHSHNEGIVIIGAAAVVGPSVGGSYRHPSVAFARRFNVAHGSRRALPHKSEEEASCAEPPERRC